MIHTIFPANRKKLPYPMFVTVTVRDWGSRRGKREYLVYHTREDRERASDWRRNGQADRRFGELYFINIYPRGKGA
jgi:hypothetical protein